MVALTRKLLPALGCLALLACEEGPAPDDQPSAERGTVLPTPVGPRPDAGAQRPDAQVPTADASIVDAAPAAPDARQPDPIPVELMPGESVALMPPEPPPEVVVPPSRGRRRMTVDQIDAAVQRVSGGIAWTDGRTETSLFQTLSKTLGKPDYIQITTEALDPSALFQKFLDDAARSVCARIVARDLETPDTADRVLLRHVSRVDTLVSNTAAVDDNLQYLLQRWHGRVAEIGSPQLAGWRWLFESATFVSGEPLDGWNAVCVGLFVSPDFYTY